MQLTKTRSLIQLTKVKANRLAKETWYGPGKFGILIFIGMLIVGIHDSFNDHSPSMFKSLSMNPTKIDALSIFKQRESQSLENSQASLENEKMRQMKIIKMKQIEMANNQNKADLDILAELAWSSNAYIVPEEESFNANENKNEFEKVSSDEIPTAEMDEQEALDRFFEEGHDFIQG